MFKLNNDVAKLLIDNDISISTQGNALYLSRKGVKLIALDLSNKYKILVTNLLTKKITLINSEDNKTLIDTVENILQIGDITGYISDFLKSNHKISELLANINLPISVAYLGDRDNLLRNIQNESIETGIELFVFYTEYSVFYIKGVFYGKDYYTTPDDYEITEIPRNPKNIVAVINNDDEKM